MVLDSETAPVRAVLVLEDEGERWPIRLVLLAGLVHNGAVRRGVAASPWLALAAGQPRPAGRVRWSSGASRASVALLGAVALEGEGTPEQVGAATWALFELAGMVALAAEQEPT